MSDKNIGKVIAQYHLDALLGQGGMAAVYRATDTKLNRPVAIKLMHSHLASQKAFQDRFLKEASTVARLNHPNIVRILQFDRAGSDLYMVMELIEGGNLRQYVKRLSDELRFMDLDHVIEVMRQLAEALDYAHRQGMMHRDMKPDNVLLRPAATNAGSMGYQPVVTDFGLARLIEGEDITDQPLGTYPYMSPEQCLGEKIDHRTDIYSLGIMLYELSAGRLPFMPKNLPEATRIHNYDPVTPPSAYRVEIDPPLEALILKCLAKQPSERYQTAFELAQALRMLQDGEIPYSAEGEMLDTDALATPTMSQPLPFERPDFTPPEPDESDTGRDRFITYSAEFGGMVYTLLDAPMTIGAANDQDIRLQGSRASRRHARLEREESGRYRLTDAGSVNGTYVGDTRLLGGDSAIVEPDMLVRMGDYYAWIEYVALDASQPGAALPGVAAGALVGGAVVGALANAGDSEPDIEAHIPTPPPVLPEATSVEPDIEAHIPTPPPEEQPGSAEVDPAVYEATRTQRWDMDGEPAQPAEPEEQPAETPAAAQPDSQDAPTEPRPAYDAHTPVFPELNLLQGLPERKPKSSQESPKVESPLPKEEPASAADEPTLPPSADLPTVAPGTAAEAPPVDPRPPTPVLKPESPKEDDRPAYDAHTPVFPELNFGRASGEGDRPAYDAHTPVLPELNIGAPRKPRKNIDKDAPTPVAPEQLFGKPPPSTKQVPPRTEPDVAIGVPKQPAAAKPPTPARPPAAAKPPAARPASNAGVDETIRPASDFSGMDEIDKTIMSDEGVDAGAGGIAQPGAVVDDKLVGRRIANYSLTRFIGQTSIASVYEATDLQLNRKVALRILHEPLAIQKPLQQRFIEEARASSNLDHPNIVNVLAYDQIDDYVFVVMEFVTGGSLRDYMRRLRQADKYMDHGEIMDFARQMADALHYAHQQGMLHRDIKPENIVLRETPVAGTGRVQYMPVLTDFGLASLAESGEDYTTSTSVATFPYMSPEECLGQRTDARSDIYELGVLMYELLTSQVPFQPRTMAEAIRMHTREPVVRPTDLRMGIPNDLERIVLKCLEKDVKNRYQTASELSRQLQSALDKVQKQSSDEAPTTDTDVEGLQTVVMTEPLPEQFPSVTPQPWTDEQIGFDRLVIYHERYPTLALPLNRNVFTLGRDEDQTIRLESNRVSRRHARLERGIGNSYRIVDIGSLNGTYLGSDKLLPNVTAVWSYDKTLRLGDYWLQIEPAQTKKTERPRTLSPQLLGAVGAMSSAASARSGARTPIFEPPGGSTLTNLDDEYEGQYAGVGEEGVRQGRSGRRVVLADAEHDKVGLKVPIPFLTVQPGSSVTMQLEAHNLSTLVDQFIIIVEGLPESWYMVQQAPINLMPNNRETATITFHPPLVSSSSEGQHYFEVRLLGRTQQIRSVAVQCALNILPFKQFTTAMEPLRVRARNRPEIMISNTGNTYTTYTLQARDREQMIDFQLTGKQFTLGPGQTEYVSLRLRARERPFIGVERSIPFEVLVSTGSELPPPQSVNGELLVRPRFPAWILTFLMIGLVLCVLISLFAYTQIQAAIAANATATIASHQTATANATSTLIIVATGVPQTATADALADPDNDTLSNIQEKEALTDPLNPDTDKDGLKDGEEVRIWNTNPLNPDTDGDKLKDGDEVNTLGTDPLQKDTDGDGLEDGADPAQLLPSTGTPTPFPTLPGTAGEICAGSPPTRLKVGIEGNVEPGGVANRVRDNPGTQQGAVIAMMPPSSSFQIIEGPQCDPDEQLRWWKVDFNGVQGWTAEGKGDEYYLCLPGACGDGSGAGGGGGGGASGGADGGTGDGTVGSVPVANPEVLAAMDQAISGLPDASNALLDRTRMGVQLFKSLDTASWQQALDRTGQMRFAWIKVQLNWSQLQPDGPGSLGGSFGVVEQNIIAARQRGYRILISIAKAPNWARGGSAESGPPDDPQALVGFLDLMLPRIGQYIDAVEIWNEPNLRSEWASFTLPFDGSGYMRLFIPARDAIRRYSPTMTVVTAGLAPTGNSVGSVSDRIYLQQMYASGLGLYKDAVVGVHPYPWGNAPDLTCCDAVDGRGWDDNRVFFFRDTLADYRSIMLANGHDVQMWVTEFGWATWADFPGTPPEPWIAYNSLTDQATHTLRAFQIGQSLSFVGPMFLWNLNFANTTAIVGGDQRAAYSLIINDNQMRPAFGSLVPGQ